jgi:hypothetical protein
MFAAYAYLICHNPGKIVCQKPEPVKTRFALGLDRTRLLTGGRGQWVTNCLIIKATHYIAAYFVVAVLKYLRTRSGVV